MDFETYFNMCDKTIFFWNVLICKIVIQQLFAHSWSCVTQAATYSDFLKMIEAFGQ